MSLKYHCPRCGHKMISKALRVGDATICPSCSTRMTVPFEAAETDEEPNYEVDAKALSASTNAGLPGEGSHENRSALSRVFVSPAGAVLMLFCFFLPWVKGAYGYWSKSGASLGGELWLVPVAAIVILTAFFAYQSQRRIRKAKPFAIWSALASLAIMLVDYVHVKRESGELWSFVKLDIGAIGTLIGLGLALIGAVFLEDEPSAVSRPGTLPANMEASFCAKCGERLQRGDSFCPTCGARKE